MTNIQNTCFERSRRIFQLALQSKSKVRSFIRIIMFYLVAMLFFFITNPLSTIAINNSNNIEYSLINYNRHYFILSDSTFLKINKYTNLIINANVTMEDDIRGKGWLIIRSEKAIKFNANNYSINKLKINNTEHIELTGHLQIKKQLEIVNSSLLLNDFNLFLLQDAITSTNTQKQIIKNGHGRIIIKYFYANQSNLPWQLKHSIAGFSLLLSNTELLVFSFPCDAFYYNSRLTQIFIDADVPPPKVK